LYGVVQQVHAIPSVYHGVLHPESTYCTSNSLECGLVPVQLVLPLSSRAFSTPQCCRTQRRRCIETINNYFKVDNRTLQRLLWAREFADVSRQCSSVPDRGPTWLAPWPPARAAAACRAL
jgi:hypothetical protein